MNISVINIAKKIVFTILDIKTNNPRIKISDEFDNFSFPFSIKPNGKKRTIYLKIFPLELGKLQANIYFFVCFEGKNGFEELIIEYNIKGTVKYIQYLY